MRFLIGIDFNFGFALMPSGVFERYCVMTFNREYWQ